MNKLLYIQSSPRGERSYCIRTADTFIKTYKKEHPDDQIVTLNVFEENIPAFKGFTIQAKYAIMHGKEHTKEQLEAWQNVEKLIDQFKSADKYVLAVPMWNFSIPYQLKMYIDNLVQPGYTFTYSQEKGYEGLAGGKPVLVVYSRGGQYAPGSGAEDLDLQKKYIELILRFIGLNDIKSIIVEPTLQGGPDTAKEKLDEAIKQAGQIAVDF
jgi:FMN-dependent NADH-azoreductase